MTQLELGTIKGSDRNLNISFSQSAQSIWQKTQMSPWPCCISTRKHQLKYASFVFPGTRSCCCCSRSFSGMKALFAWRSRWSDRLSGNSSGHRRVRRQFPPRCCPLSSRLRFTNQQPACKQIRPGFLSAPECNLAWKVRKQGMLTREYKSRRAFSKGGPKKPRKPVSKCQTLGEKDRASKCP